MDEKARARGSDDRRRATPLFDPVAGMRAMAEIQAEGLRAAGELLERVLEPGARSDPAPRRESVESDYAALMNAWFEMLQRFTAGLAQPAESGAVTIPIDAAAMGPPLRLALDPSEHAAQAEVWLHNGTSAAVGPLSLRCGPLTAPDGKALKRVEVLFDPVTVDRLPPRSSRGVRVNVTSSGALRDGVYRGTIQADRAPKLWLPVEVTVPAATDPC